MSRLDIIEASIKQTGSSRISAGKTPDNMKLDEAGAIAMKEGTKSKIDKNNATRNRSMKKI